MRQRGGRAPTRAGAVGLAAPLGAKGHRHARPAGTGPLEPGIGPPGLCVTLSVQVANTCSGCGATFDELQLRVVVRPRASKIPCCPKYLCADPGQRHRSV